MKSGAVHANGQRSILLPVTTIAAAVTGTVTTPVTLISGMEYLVCEAQFLYGSGGTTAKFWVQTSIDGGLTWIDVINFAFATAAASKVSAVVATTALAAGVTPTDATLADNTILSGLLGDRLRVKYTTVGTYAGATSIRIDAISKG